MMENSNTDTIRENNSQKRGGCLSTFLIVMIVLNAILAIYYLLAGDIVLQGMPGMPEWAIYVLALAGILNTIFAIYVWKWKKIGVYGFAGTALAVFIINLIIGINILAALLGLTGPVILYFLVKPHWHRLE